jgi:hypothetical protein
MMEVMAGTESMEHRRVAEEEVQPDLGVRVTQRITMLQAHVRERPLMMELSMEVTGLQVV